MSNSKSSSLRRPAHERIDKRGGAEIPGIQPVVNPNPGTDSNPGTDPNTGTSPNVGTNPTSDTNSDTGTTPETSGAGSSK